MPVPYEEDCVCLYKDGDSHVFSKDEVKGALADGWKDSPVANEPKRRGRPPKVAVEE